MPTRRGRLACLPLLAALAAAASAHAAGNLVDVQIVDRSQGHVLAQHRHRGMPYVAGQPGTRYAVQLTNRSDARVLVVLSIDGVNAVSGETAAVGQTGYVLAPYQSTEITGWRKSYTEAAAFYFTSLADSYAARTDRPDNVGVIGAAIFRERMVRPEPRAFDRAPPIAQKDSSARAQAPGHDAGASAEAESSVGRSAPAQAPAEDARERLASRNAAPRLGTGHGEREYSPTSQTAFERASSQPAEVVRVRYESMPTLVAMGVIGGRRHVPTEPEAFPRFTPDPR